MVSDYSAGQRAFTVVGSEGDPIELAPQTADLGQELAVIELDAATGAPGWARQLWGTIEHTGPWQFGFVQLRPRQVTVAGGKVFVGAQVIGSVDSGLTMHLHGTSREVALTNTKGYEKPVLIAIAAFDLEGEPVWTSAVVGANFHPEHSQSEKNPEWCRLRAAQASEYGLALGVECAHNHGAVVDFGGSEEQLVSDRSFVVTYDASLERRAIAPFPLGEQAQMERWGKRFVLTSRAGETVELPTETLAGPIVPFETQDGYLAVFDLDLGKP